ncbi:hypothetical protein LOC68_24520 [Blastopirellula sp. JC732]|uniref:Transmembrane protein n=1 Tax=Blastopirellula sediminis TaxID=2894196 RepID=A0A9X1SMD1_9BACT|nr:DUF6790 family protein [Blastopirellula sediminis]MCC9605126.1 hypothetical protein [Blastopirellula sediminis]MCC9631574.1 hypothetical protein [Blastopirellula sediminis]
MIETILRLVLSNYPITFLVVGLICSAISLSRQPKPLTKHVVFEKLLAYYCLSAVGFFYIYNFVMHVFFGEFAARFIGWADSPFQLEVGFASLGFGLVGLLAFCPDFGLRLAANLGPACFMWGAAAGHVYQMVANHNFAPGNAGTMFWADIFLPIIGFFFLAGWRMTAPTRQSTVAPEAPA